MDIGDLVEHFKLEEFRTQNHNSTFCNLYVLLQDIVKPNEEKQQELLSIFRALRNSCIDCLQNQTAIAESGIPGIVIQLLVKDEWKFSDSERMITAGLQFLGNFVAGNTATQKHVWELGFPRLFKHFMNEKISCERHFVICSMIFYNCLSSLSAMDQIFSNAAGEEIVLAMCNALCTLSNHDWVVLSITDHFLKEGKFLPLAISKCSYAAQHTVLHVYCDWMAENSDSSNSSCSTFTAVYLGELFVDKCYKLGCTEADLDFFAILLKSYCWATATPGPWKGEAKIFNVIETAILLLRGITKAGDHGNDAKFYKYLSSHFGRRDLVRLVGNLCFESSMVQDRIRSLGGISLLLDACSIDDGNPFMQQWAVFAIRNLCQGNLANQAEIARLERLGVANSPVLRDLGLTAVEGEAGKMKITSLK